MIEDHIGRELHQRQFAGEELTEAETSMLTAWYAQQDEREAAEISHPSSANVNDQLRTQISDVLNQLVQLTQRIQQIAQENEKIRQENARLIQLLLQKTKAA